MIYYLIIIHRALVGWTIVISPVVLVDHCRRPLAQPRDSTMREECAALDEQNLLLKERKKGLCVEHQNGFYELLTKPRMKAI